YSIPLGIEQVRFKRKFNMAFMVAHRAEPAGNKRALLAHIMLMEVAMPIHKSRNLSYKQLPTFHNMLLTSPACYHERKYYLYKDQEKEKLRNRFPFITLLEQNQDTYKSKDTTGFRPRGGSSSNRRGRSGTTDTQDVVAQPFTAPQLNSYILNFIESGGVYGKPVYTRENGVSSYTASTTLAHRVVPRTANWNSPTYRSVRMLAALCSFVGLKASFGRVPPCGYSWKLGMVGILAGTIQNSLITSIRSHGNKNSLIAHLL
ncbi:putative ribonuclease H-like domain-containing protein, partial [Tanacetum coccineum]